MSKKIDIHFYHTTPLAIKLIEETFKKSFSRGFDSNYWRWRFLNNPNCDKVYINYILENNKLAAYYAVTPEIIHINQKSYKIALSNMTMTHPSCQGRGYFKLLAKAMYEQLKEDGFIAVYGFANSNSHYGFRKYLNWKDVSILNIFKVKKENFRDFLVRKDNELEFVLSNDLNLENCELNQRWKHKKHISRNVSHLNWRLKEIPNNTYQILEAKKGDTFMKIVIKRYQDEIDIIEIFDNCTDSQSYELFLTNTIHYLICFQKGEAINIWSNLHDFEHLILEKIGFQEDSFNTYFGVIPLDKTHDLTNIRDWYYRFYDSDIF